MGGTPSSRPRAALISCADAATGRRCSPGRGSSGRSLSWIWRRQACQIDRDQTRFGAHKPGGWVVAKRPWGAVAIDEGTASTATEEDQDRRTAGDSRPRQPDCLYARHTVRDGQRKSGLKEAWRHGIAHASPVIHCGKQAAEKGRLAGSPGLRIGG